MKRKRIQKLPERFELRMSISEKQMAIQLANKRGITLAAWLRDIMRNEFSTAR